MDGQLVFNNSELPWHTTMNVSYITGGEAINQVHISGSPHIRNTGNECA